MSILKNKMIILTGGLGFIGKKLTVNLVQNGAKVIVLDIKSFKEFKNIKNFRNLENLNYFRCDVSNLNSLKKILPKILKISKKIDVLINNAALNDSLEKKTSLKLSKFENFPEKYWNDSIKANLNSLFLCSQIFGTQMIKYNDGSIINIASTYGIVGPDQKIYQDKKLKNFFYKNPAYPTAKGGVISFTKYLASYWGKNGIRVNCLSPGGLENEQKEIFIKNYSSKTLIGRMGKAEDLFGVIRLLCSEESSYITGANFIIDGGWTSI